MKLLVIKISPSEWEAVFVKDVDDKIKESKTEFDEYKDTNKIVYLQQAGNKIFSAVENHLMLKYKTRVRSYQALRKLVKNNVNDRRLVSKAAQLHYFFYQNTVMGEPQEYEDIYLEVYETIKGRIDTKKKKLKEKQKR